MKKNPKTPTLTAQRALMVRKLITSNFHLSSLFLCRLTGRPNCALTSTEKTRDELRVQVYDAMAEKKNEDAEKAEGKQSEEKEKSGDEEQNAAKEEEDEGKKGEVNGGKSESEDKAENDKGAEESGDKEEEAEGDFSFFPPSVP